MDEVRGYFASISGLHRFCLPRRRHGRSVRDRDGEGEVSANAVGMSDLGCTFLRRARSAVPSGVRHLPSRYEHNTADFA
jgi:hypothetical protein